MFGTIIVIIQVTKSKSTDHSTSFKFIQTINYFKFNAKALKFITLIVLVYFIDQK